MCLLTTLPQQWLSRVHVMFCFYFRCSWYGRSQIWEVGVKRSLSVVVLEAVVSMEHTRNNSWKRSNCPPVFTWRKLAGCIKRLVAAETCFRAATGVAGVTWHFNLLTWAQTAGNKLQPVCRKNNNTMGIFLDCDKSEVFHTTWRVQKNSKRRQCLQEKDTSVEPLWVSVHSSSLVPMGAQVIIDQKSACQLSIPVWPLCPLVIDVTGQFWHMVDACFFLYGNIL